MLKYGGLLLTKAQHDQTESVIHDQRMQHAEQQNYLQNSLE